MYSRKIMHSSFSPLLSYFITSAKEVMFLPGFVCPSVCLFACEQDNSKPYGRICSWTKVSGGSLLGHYLNKIILGVMLVTWFLDPSTHWLLYHDLVFQTHVMSF